MFATNVPFDLFKERQNKCREEVIERNLNGVMIWSRGGGTWDRYAGVDYFANHYQQRCYLPDQEGLWNGRSHCVLLIPNQGEPVLLVTTLEYRKDLVAVKDIRYSPDFFTLLEDTAKELKMDLGNVGVMYEDVLTWKIGKEIAQRMPNMNMVACDDILSDMRVVKDSREIKSIEKACEIGSKAVEIIMNNAKPGKTEAQIIGPAMDLIFSEGAVLYFIVTSSGPHSDSVHSIDFPGYDSTRLIKEGEMFKVDLIICYEGYICDFGRTTIVKSKPSSKEKKMIECVANACEHVMGLIKPGITVKELYDAGDNYLLNEGISLDSQQDDENKIYASFPPHWGHSIGMTWEKPWLISEDETVIKEGMYLAVEKGLYSPGTGTATYEQNLIVTKEGSRTLTTTKKIWID